ncbi:hypothetical protein [Cytobacillus purgationiresistens]|uniref:Uncharacterized protein n=1 Tax=Cytobacillus purgationiresistens TaxID=863449 RepID=A0ABU0AFJ7_9BACI|nr:hypothetical protein [Cytobacillus purgationiresistens]MDQ0268865.1 hypothetical protein [Cytobacillus purgationiresistens]
MTIELGVLIAIGGLLLSLLTLQFNKSKETKNDIKHNTRIETRLDHIVQGVEDIKVDFRTNEKRMNDFGERVTRVEESTKQAHRRIDQIKREESK